MADYKIHLGVKLNTGDINTQINNIKANSVNVKAILDTSDIKTKIAGFNQNPEKIKVQAELSTKGFATTINNFNGKKTVKFHAELIGVTKDFGTAIKAYEDKGRKVKFGVDLDTNNIAAAINDFNANNKSNNKINLGVQISRQTFTSLLQLLTNEFAKNPIPIKVTADFDKIDFKSIEGKLKGYTPTTPIKPKVQLVKGKIDEQIKSYNDSATKKAVNLKVRLTHASIADAINAYSAGEGKSLQIPVNLSLRAGTKNAEFVAELAKVKQELLNTPLKAPVVLTKGKGYADEVNKFPINVEAKLQNKEEIRTAITGVTNKITDIPVKLKPAAKGFDSAITTKPVTVKAELDKASSTTISGQLAKIKQTTPIVVNAELNPTSITTITNQLANLKPKNPIVVDAKINETIVDDKDENKSKKSQPINVKPILDDESIDAQLESYKAFPILVPVQLQTEKINEQLKEYKSTKLKVGVSLDFSSHKDGTKGVPQQIKEYKTSSKIKVGVELDKESVNEQIRTAQSNEPIALGVKLDLEPVKAQIEELKNEFKKFGQITINFPNANANNDKTNTKTSGISGFNSGNIISPKAIESVEKFTASVKNSNTVVKGMEDSLGKLGVSFDNKKAKSITEDIENMNIEIKEVVTTIEGSKLTMSITGIQETASGVKKIVELTREYENAVINAANANQTITQKFVTSYDRQKQEAKETNKAYRDMLSAITEIQSISINIGKAKSSGWDTTLLEQNLTRAINRYKEFAAVTKGKLDDNQVRNLDNAWQKLSNNVGAADQKLLDIAKRRAELAQQRQEIKNTNEAYKEMKSLVKDITKTKIDILNAEAEGKEVDELKNKLASLISTYEQLEGKFYAGFDQNQSLNMANYWKQSNHDVEVAKEAISNNNAQIANTIRGNFEGYEAKIDGIVRSTQRLAHEYPKLKEAIDNAKIALEKMRNAGEDNDAVIAAEKEYQEAILKTQGLLSSAQSSEGEILDEERFVAKKADAQARLNALFEQGSAAAKKFGGQAASLNEELRNIGSEKELNILNKKISALARNVRSSGLQIKTFSSRIKEQFARYSQYVSVATLFMRGYQAARSMFEQVKLIDSAMTELKKVTNETDVSYDKFLTNAASRAKELGTTIDSLVSSTADFARLGYSFEDSQGLAEVANIYAVVGDEIDSVETATESLISTLTAFKNEANGMSDSDFAMSIVDKMNEVSNNFAISSGGIGEALQKSASSMMAANNSLDETIALITAANTVVQNPDTVGTAFKTISMRIRGAKTEMEEAGLETDGMAESTAKLREEIKALSGVDIMLDNNTFKSTYQILEELAGKWQDLTDIQQASVTELIAGKRQGNIVSSLMNNFDIANAALETSLNSSGSAMAEHEKWSESLEARLNKLKATWQSLSQTILSSKFLGWLINGATKIVGALDSIIKSVGALNTILIASGITIFSKNFGQLISLGLQGATSIDLVRAATAKMSETDLAAILIKTNLTAAEQAQLLVEKGLSSSRATMIASANTMSGADLYAALTKTKLTEAITAETLASSGLTKEQVAAAVASSNLTAANLAEILATTSLTKEQQIAILVNKGLTQAEAESTVATYAQSTANVVATGTTTGFTAAISRLSIALKGLWAFLTRTPLGWVVLASTAIYGIVKAIDAFTVSAEELKEKVDEVTSKYKEQHESLIKLKDDYDTSNEDSMISKYKELSKGVDSFGENLSLTTDEYEEYRNIVNTIAEQMPNLVTGYNSQGDAILSCAGDVDVLAES